MVCVGYGNIYNHQRDISPVRQLPVTDYLLPVRRDALEIRLTF